MDSQITIETAKTMLEASPVGTLLFDDGGQLVWANEQILNVLGTAPDNMAKITRGDIKGRFVAAADDIYQMADAESRFYQIRSHEISAKDQSYQVWYVTDVSEMESIRQTNLGLRKRVNEFAMLDPDTGLLTYPALLQNLELLITRSRRYGNPMSLLKIDVQCNVQELPREALLTSVGHMLKDQMRWADLISRGDDGRFVVIMPETPVEAVNNLVDKIRQNLATLQIPVAGDKSCQIIPAFGLTAWVKGDDSGLLLTRLDQALGTAISDAENDLVKC